jgi:hypothetical protein
MEMDMPKDRLTRQQYVDEVNREMALDAAYKPGMRVFLAPVGTNGANASGTNYEGEEPAVRGVWSAAEARVRARYEIEEY